MLNFLKNDVGCSPGEFSKTGDLLRLGMVGKLPESVRRLLRIVPMGGKGGPKARRTRSPKGTDSRSASVWPDSPARGLNRRTVPVRTKSPTRESAQAPGFGSDGHHNQFQLYGATVLYKGDIDSLKEEVNNYIDQLNDSNNLFMTKFKNVVNTMNEALDGANSMADKSHDTLKNLVSRW